jgi:hypothetical protein
MDACPPPPPPSILPDCYQPPCCVPPPPVLLCPQDPRCAEGLGGLHLPAVSTSASAGPPGLPVQATQLRRDGQLRVAAPCRRGAADLGWAGLGWAGLGWAGLGWAGLGRSSTGRCRQPGDRLSW